MREALAFLWPALLFGAMGTALFFGVLDALEMHFAGPLAYGVGLVLFFGLALGWSWLTSFVERWHAHN